MNLRKFLAVVFMLAIVSWRASADFKRCPDFVQKDSVMSEALSYLQSIRGTYALGSCKIELHVCDSFSSDPAAGSVVGDILITGQQGVRNYLQFDFAKMPDQKLPVRMMNGKIMLHYEADDLHGDAALGKRQSKTIEFLVSMDKKKLVSIEEGSFSSKEWQQRHSGSVYNWNICHGDLALTKIQGIKSDDVQ